jgi:hypothetical protein
MAQPDYRYTITPSRAIATAAAPPIRPDMIFGKGQELCHRQRARRLLRSRQLVSTGVLCRKASSSICLTRKSATSAREMNPHVQPRGSTNAR